MSRGIGIAKLPTGEPVEGNHWLLLIGIDTYLHWQPLRGPVKDCLALEAVLQERYLFHPDRTMKLLDTDATRGGIFGALRHLQESVDPKDSVLIYYAGHGYTDAFTNTGYWIPQDAGVDPEEGDRWLPNVAVRGALGAMECAHVLLLSDSCFSGDLLDEYRGSKPQFGNNYFERAYRYRSRQVMTSGASELVSDVALGGHSPFAYHVLDTLRRNTDPCIDPLRIYDYVRRGVEGQQPLLGALAGAGHQREGSFLFFRRGEPGEAAVELPEEPSPDPEEGSVEEDTGERKAANLARLAADPAVVDGVLREFEGKQTEAMWEELDYRLEMAGLTPLDEERLRAFVERRARHDATEGTVDHLRIETQEKPEGPDFSQGTLQRPRLSKVQSALRVTVSACKERRTLFQTIVKLLIVIGGLFLARELVVNWADKRLRAEKPAERERREAEAKIAAERSEAIRRASGERLDNALSVGEEFAISTTKTRFQDIGASSRGDTSVVWWAEESTDGPRGPWTYSLRVFKGSTLVSGASGVHSTSDIESEYYLAGGGKKVSVLASMISYRTRYSTKPEDAWIELQSLVLQEGVLDARQAGGPSQLGIDRQRMDFAHEVRLSDFALAVSRQGEYAIGYISESYIGVLLRAGNSFANRVLVGTEDARGLKLDFAPKGNLIAAWSEVPNATREERVRVVRFDEDLKTIADFEVPRSYSVQRLDAGDEQIALAFRSYAGDVRVQSFSYDRSVTGKGLYLEKGESADVAILDSDHTMVASGRSLGEVQVCFLDEEGSLGEWLSLAEEGNLVAITALPNNKALVAYVSGSHLKARLVAVHL